MNCNQAAGDSSGPLMSGRNGLQSESLSFPIRGYSPIANTQQSVGECDLASGIVSAVDVLDGTSPQEPSL